MFLEKEAGFFEDCFDNVTIKRTFYDIFVTQAFSDYKEKLIQEFLNGFLSDLRHEIFSELYLKLIVSLKRLTQ